MTNKTIIRIGNTFSFIDGEAIKIVPRLAPGVYEVNYDEKAGSYSLDYVRDEMTVPPKVYGKTRERLDKVISVWQRRDASTGVLMSGDAGSGKTVLAKMIANEVIRMGHPVLMVSKKAQPGNPSFSSFLRDVKGRVMVLFDEFEKMFDKVDDQSSLLTLMDGADSTDPKLFVLTANLIERVNPYLLGRPGRVRYHFNYNASDDQVIREYCAEKGVCERDAEDIVVYGKAVGSVNFDSLVSIVEEMAMTGLPFKSVMEDLNLPVVSGSGLTFTFRLISDGVSVPQDKEPIKGYDGKTYYVSFQNGINKLPEEQQEAFWEAVDDEGEITVDVSGKSVVSYDNSTGEVLLASKSPRVFLALTKTKAQNPLANIFSL